jgi:serine/alanine adding enzyme
MNVEIGAADVAAAPDVYFTRGYGVASAIADGGEWVMTATPDGRWQLPLVVRPLPGGDLDAVSPYGYSGIHADLGLDGAALRSCWTDSVRQLRAMGVITLFLRFSPLEDVSPLVRAGLPGLDVRHRSATTAVDIRDTDAAWSRMRGRSRTAVRKAEKSGLVGSVRRLENGDLTAGSAFRRLYDGTMARVSSADYYRLPDEYYDALAHGLGDAVRIAEVVDADGRTVAAALVLSHGTFVHYHLAGSDPVAARLGANNLLVWSICRWAAAQGATLLHLGGGIGGGSSLMTFKESFGGGLLDFHTGQAVLDEDKLAAHTHRRSRELGCTPEELTGSGFFPPYRSPLAVA